MNEDQEWKDMASRIEKDIASQFNEGGWEWMEAHLPEMRQYATGQRLLYQSLVASVVIGLLAQVGGYFL